MLTSRLLCLEVNWVLLSYVSFLIFVSLLLWEVSLLLRLEDFKYSGFDVLA